MIGNMVNKVTERLIGLKDSKGSIEIEDLKDILEDVAKMFGNGTSPLDIFLRDEIIKISNYIETTKNEIIALAPDSGSGKDIGVASVQLDAVLKSTEEAANNIMDATEEIQNLVAASSMSIEDKNKINDISMKIYEACSFQDLTGQRITKVMKALEFTENRINRLTALFGGDGSVNLEEFAKLNKDNRPDAHLLNGPQLPSAAPSQSDIDAMFG